jgi:Flp pilus assembly pilin Flp
MSSPIGGDRDHSRSKIGMLNLVEKYSAEAVAETEEGVVAIEYVLLAGLVAAGLLVLAGTDLWTDMLGKLNGMF